MRGIKALLMIPAAALLLLAGACTNNGLDDGSSADVILEILGFTNPPVTAAQSQDGLCSLANTVCGSNADCPLTETCIFGCDLTVVDWNVSMANVPKNTLATGPANDIALIDVTVSYAGLVPAVAPTSFGLGGQVIPTGGSGSVTFTPIRLNDLDVGHLSSTASLLLSFRGQTLEGTGISLTVARDLGIEECQ